MQINTEIALNESLRLAALDSYGLSYLEANDDSDAGSKVFGLADSSKQISKKRCKYQRIDDSLRQKLIDAVVKDGQMLKAAAKKFKINYSSAKSIFHTYRKEGRVNKKAVRDRYIRTSYISASGVPNLKQIRKSSLSDIKSTLDTTETSSVFLPKTDLKTAQIKPYIMDPLPTIQESPVLAKVDKLGMPTEYALNNPFSMQSYRLMQNIMQQNANIRLLQEFTKLQSMVPAALPLLAQKQQVVGQQSAVMGLQQSLMQLQAASQTLGGLDFQKFQYNGVQGFNNYGSLFSVGTGGN